MAGQHAGDDEDDAEDAARAFGWGTAALHIAFASVVSRKELCRATLRARRCMHRSWWVYPRHPLLRRTWHSLAQQRRLDGRVEAQRQRGDNNLRGFITTAAERAPTRGRPSAGSRGNRRQTRRLNSLNSQTNP